MPRLRALEGREAGILAACIQLVYRRVFGCPINPVKVLARVPRALLASFASNALLGSGRWTLGRDLVSLVRIRAAARNGCPF
jgi:alkylhydroperoxidase family enzyme